MHGFDHLFVPPLTGPPPHRATASLFYRAAGERALRLLDLPGHDTQHTGQRLGGAVNESAPAHTLPDALGIYWNTCHQHAVKLEQGQVLIVPGRLDLR